MDRKTYDLLVRAVTEEKRSCLGETMTVKELLDLGWNSVRLRWANDDIPTALLWKDCEDEYSLDDETHNPLQEKVLNVVVKVEDHYEEDADGFPIVYCDEVVTNKVKSYYRELFDKVCQTKMIPVYEEVNYDVASELNAQCTQKLSDEQFDEACSLIKEVYLKYEALSIFAITAALIKITEDNFENFDFKSISRAKLADEACYQ